MTSSFLDSPFIRGLLLGLGILTAGPALAAPPALKPRPAAEKSARARLPADTAVERLVVKFHEGSRVRLRGHRLVALSAERTEAERAQLSQRGLSEARLGTDLDAARALLSQVPRTGNLARLFREDESVLAERKREGEARGGQQLADLDLYFEVRLVPGTRASGVEELVDALNALDSVEVAYAEPPAEPAMVNFGMDATLRSLLAAADIAPTTPLYEGSQGYLNAAPAGIDARFAWGMPGGRGAGVRVVDIEGGWRTTHEDMPALFHQGGTQFNDVGWRNHGTAVLGEIVGAPNGYGVTGIAHQAQAGVEGIGGGRSTASAVSSAAGAVGRGGVVLIELHAQGPADSTPCTCNPGQCNYIAMEYWQANYDAIATATANGVTVVEAAGNGSANLDEAVYGNAFNRAVRDSGAILVGASTATTRVPMCWTNFGGRVDVHGWGEQVVTMGYGDLFNPGDENQWYTSTFSGTSSASPIVTGAAVSVQGVARAHGRAPLEPRAVRGLLANTGTPQAASAQNIGRLPNLRQALSQLVSSCTLMASGQALLGSQSLNACQGNAVLSYQGDGNLVLYRNGAALWNSGTYGHSAGRAVMQPDGNFVIYNAANQAVFASNTAGNPGAQLDLQQQCTLVVRHPNGQVLWSSGSQCVSRSCGALLTEDVLYPGQGITACNGAASVVHQGDGNVVMYRNGQALWASGTSGQVTGRFVMQPDGHLVLYGINGQPLWASGTSGNSGATFWMQDDCNGVIYGAGGALWVTGTSCQ